MLLPPSDLFDDNFDDPKLRKPHTLLCARCLADGEFDDSESPIHVGDIDQIWQALKTLHPEMNARQLGEEADARLSELAVATPPLAKELALPWPVHCDDFCEFMAYATAQELPSVITEEGLKADPQTAPGASLSPAENLALFACLSCSTAITVPTQ